MSATTSASDQLEKRLISFAAAIVSLRSGTAAAANYGEARGAESRADFLHKLKVVFKELNETTIWLEVIAQTSLLSAETTAAIIVENRELCRIIAASIKTARASGQ